MLGMDELIEAVSQRVLMYVDKKRIDYIYYLLLGEYAGRHVQGLATDVDRYFHFFFRSWSLAWIRWNLAPHYQPQDYPIKPGSHYFCWYYYFQDNTDSQESAVDLFFDVSKLFFEDYRKKQDLKKYHKVRMMSDSYTDDGITENMIGYIIEIYDDRFCEVEFSNSDGSTIACQTIDKAHFMLLDD